MRSVAYALMPFRPVTAQMDPIAIETTLLEQWQSEGTFARSLELRKDAEPWVFYEGPPTANGRPGIHHVWARLFKDIYPRFQTMRGRYVQRRAGWDCHGLPVEVEVEKELGFSGKEQIEAFGIEEFNDRCRASVQRYVDDWKQLTDRIGMWLDTDNAYWTMSPTFVESVWWLFGQLWEKGLIFEGEKVVPYCGRCGTALSSHELAQPGAYSDITDNSVYVRFPLIEMDADLLVWTTTPWTLPSNVAVAISPDLEYVRVSSGEGQRDVILAAARLEAVLEEGAKVVARLQPEALAGLMYERPLPYLPTTSPAKVLVDAFVTADDGSGIVHLAPAFGEIDRDVCLAAAISGLNPVGPKATFVDDRLPWVGQFVRDADPEILQTLEANGSLFKVVPYQHSYPHCWRCSTPLIYWGKPTWFVRTSEHKETLLAANETVNWHPATIKAGRFGNWLEHNIDWALSRDRFWGTPIPIWRCESGHDTCIASLAELSERSGTDCSATDPHRPYVDDISIACGTCGEPARRVEPVLDAWFDSGSMPAAQSHFPFDSSGGSQPAAYPADFICEGIDQTRGWFYSLLAVNTLVFGSAPYRNVMCLALVVDKDGQKMSKSKGNVLNPWEVLDTRGADALRWNMVASGSPWTTRRVFIEAIDETTRSFLITLWNTYSFFVTYANLDSYEPDTADRLSEAPTADADIMDRWMRSRLHGTIETVTTALESFDALTAANALASLVDDCSNWYVRRCRTRFWKNSDRNAHATLHEVLETVSLLLAPLCPFVSDSIWQNLSGTNESVHLQHWPTADTAAIDHELDEEMELARSITSIGRAARTNAKMKVRQPLHRARYLANRPLRAALESVVAAELNVKALLPVSDLDDVVENIVIPNFSKLGPRIGPALPAVKQFLSENGPAVAADLRSKGAVNVNVDGELIELTNDDLEVRVQAKPGFAVTEEHGIAVALDTTLDDDLRNEGFSRELIRWLNDARKELGYEISDRISVQIQADQALQAALMAHQATIAEEVLALEWELVPQDQTVDGNAETTIEEARVTARLAVIGRP